MLYFDPIMMNNNKYRWYKNPCLFVCFAKDCFRSCSNCSSRRKFIGSLISETQKIGWYWDIKVSFGRVVNCNSNYHISFFIFFFVQIKYTLRVQRFVIDWYFQVLFFVCLFFRIMCEIVDRQTGKYYKIREKPNVSNCSWKRS